METEAALGDVKLYCPNPACSMLVIADVRQRDEPIDCPHCRKVSRAGSGRRAAAGA